MSDPQQFVDLYSQHNRRIFAYILTLVPNVNDADEVFQETSRVLWEKFAEYEPGTHFGAWACAVAQYCALSFHRRQQRHHRLFSPEFVTAIEEHIDTSGSEDETCAARGRFLQECLEKLPASLREAIHLRYLTGATTQSTAEQLEKSPNAVRKLVGRGRRALHDCIEGRMAEEGYP